MKLFTDTLPNQTKTSLLIYVLLLFITLSGIAGCGGGSSGDPEPDKDIQGESDNTGAEEPKPDEPKPDEPKPDEPKPDEPKPVPATLAPTNFQVSTAGNKATFTWDPVVGVQKYTLYIAEQSGLKPDNYASYTGGDMLDDVKSPYIYTLPGEKPYFAIITATNDGKEGTASEEIGIHVTITQPEAGDRLTRISMAHDGTELLKNVSGGSGSHEASISNDGRYVAFSSYGNKVVSGDNNNSRDVFVYDRNTGKTTRVSVTSNGSEGNGNSFRPAISGNGNFIAFQSGSSNLVSGDTDVTDDIFIHNRLTGKTTIVSVGNDGSKGVGKSDYPALNYDGQFVAFRSDAYNLVENDSNNKQDIFVRNLKAGKTERVSVAGDGRQGDNFSGVPSISADGRYVAFRSEANNLSTNDVNGDPDIFVHDRNTGKTTVVSVDHNGNAAWGLNGQKNPSISADGQYVAFQSIQKLTPDDSNFDEDIYVRDLVNNTTTLISKNSGGKNGAGKSDFPSISGDGRYVVFQSAQKDLVPDDSNSKPDIFLHDRDTSQITRISVANDDTEGNKWSVKPVISASGLYVAFESTSNNLVTGDKNGIRDIFIYDRGEKTP